jgi:hypothetical protein
VDLLHASSTNQAEDSITSVDLPEAFFVQGVHFLSSAGDISSQAGQRYVNFLYSHSLTLAFIGHRMNAGARCYIWP